MFKIDIYENKIVIAKKSGITHEVVATFDREEVAISLKRLIDGIPNHACSDCKPVSELHGEVKPHSATRKISDMSIYEILTYMDAVESDIEQMYRDVEAIFSKINLKKQSLAEYNKELEKKGVL